MCFFFSAATATTEAYTLSLHDALPISSASRPSVVRGDVATMITSMSRVGCSPASRRKTSASPLVLTWSRSEEHTSELQSRGHLVCRLLLEKKNRKSTRLNSSHVSISYD